MSSFDNKKEGLPQFERRKNESEKAFAAFVAYRNLGQSRSLRGAFLAMQAGTEEGIENPPSSVPPTAQRGGGGGKAGYPSSFDNWSRTHEWQKRARAWDLEQAERAEEAQTEADAAMVAQVEKDIWEDIEELKKEAADAFTQSAIAMADPKAPSGAGAYWKQTGANLLGRVHDMRMEASGIRSLLKDYEKIKRDEERAALGREEEGDPDADVIPWLQFVANTTRLRRLVKNPEVLDDLVFAGITQG